MAVWASQDAIGAGFGDGPGGDGVTWAGVALPAWWWHIKRGLVAMRGCASTRATVLGRFRDGSGADSAPRRAVLCPSFGRTVPPVLVSGRHCLPLAGLWWVAVVHRSGEVVHTCE